MELKYLKLVKTIADEGNISKSAGRLFLTQSALSHQLKDFEERIGIKVFIRSRNNWKLTKEGQEIYEMACQVIDRIDEGLSRISKIQTGSRGTIKLATECYSFYHGLPSFIQKMNVLYPEIDISLNIESGQPISMQLLNKELDMCIVTTPITNDQVTNYELFSDELFALMSCENDLANN